MKKNILTIMALTVIVTSGISQGLVNFSGGTSAATRMSTNSVVGGQSTGLTTGGPSLYYFALFASSSQSSINGSTNGVSGLSGNYVFNNPGGGTASTGWILVGIATNNSSAGRFNAGSQGTTSGGQGGLNSDGSLTVQGINGAANANFVTVGWLSTGIGTTLASLVSWYNAGAQGGWVGQSAIATGLLLGDGGNTATPNPFGTAPGQVGGILLGLTPVPEPGTMALAALSGASLLLFRRRK
jgi:hypothetical protein